MCLADKHLTNKEGKVNKLKRFEITKFYDLPFGYKWNIKQWNYSKELNCYVYTGIGRYCKTCEEVKKYINDEVK